MGTYFRIGLCSGGQGRGTGRGTVEQVGQVREQAGEQGNRYSRRTEGTGRGTERNLQAKRLLVFERTKTMTLVVFGLNVFVFNGKPFEVLVSVGTGKCLSSLCVVWVENFH